MTPRTVYVVSDAFERFAENPGVITYATAMAALDSDTGLPVEPDVRVRPGQGLNEAQVAAFLARARAVGRDDRLDGWAADDRPAKASARLTHKARPENVLISTPRRIEESVFEADLMLDADSELMRDHVTGQHVQGMVLIEAARQTFLAVTEAFFVPEGEHGQYYFVINSMTAEYRGFVFPVDATIRYVVDRAEVAPGRLSFDVTMQVIQVGAVRAELPTSFTAFYKSSLVPKEEQRAQRTLETLGSPTEDARRAA